MQKIFLAMLVVMSLGISACVFAPPRDGYDRNHEQRGNDNDRQQRHGDDGRRDSGHDGRN